MTTVAILVAIIGGVTTVLSCSTAYIAFKREKLKNSIDAKANIPSLKLLKFRQRLPKDKSFIVFLILPTFGALGFLAVSLWLLYEVPSVGMALSAGFWTLCLLPFIIICKQGGNGPSLVRRELQFTVASDHDAVFDQCEAALLKMRAIPIARDRDLGLIYAHTGFSWKSFGERMEVAITTSDTANCTVTVVSDSVYSTTLVDYGKNTQNLNSFIRCI